MVANCLTFLSSSSHLLPKQACDSLITNRMWLRWLLWLPRLGQKRWLSSALFFLAPVLEPWATRQGGQPPGPPCCRGAAPHEGATCWHCSQQPTPTASWQPSGIPSPASLQMAELSFYCSHLRDPEQALPCGVISNSWPTGFGEKQNGIIGVPYTLVQ